MPKCPWCGSADPSVVGTRRIEGVLGNLYYKNGDTHQDWGWETVPCK